MPDTAAVRAFARRRWAPILAALGLLGIVVWALFGRGPGDKPQAITPTPPKALGAGRTVPYGEYVAGIQAARRTLAEAASKPPGERKKYLETAASALEKVQGSLVSAPVSGAFPAEIDNSVLIAAVRREGADPARIETALASLLDALDRTRPGKSMEGTADGVRARAALREVLADPVFNYEERLSPLQRLVRWLSRQAGRADPGDTLWRWATSVLAAFAAMIGVYLGIERFGLRRWRRLLVSAAAGLVVGALFYWATADLDETARVVGVVGLGVAAVAVSLITAGLRRASSPATPQPAAGLREVLGMGASEARSEAERAAASGDFRSAIRFRCLAVLLTIDEAGMLHFDRAATNREFLFRAPGNLQSELQPLLERFDIVWYGNAAVDEPGWQDYATRASALEAAAGREAAAKRRAADSAKRSAA